MKRFLYPALLAAAGAFPPAITASASAVGDKPTFPTITYCDLWTDTKGVSHLANCKLSAFEETPATPITDKFWTGQKDKGTAMVITKIQPPNWKGSWSETKQVEWIVPLSGTYFVEAMDGTRAELNAGDILLSEDQSATTDHNGHTGHLSGNVGDSPVALMVTQYESAHSSHVECSHE